MKNFSVASILRTMAGLLLAGLAVSYFTGISLWWALGFGALALLVPFMPIPDFGDDDSSPGADD